jgi:hypothetical protein
MDGVSLSKESCRFVEKEKSLYFDYISKVLTRPCNLSKARSAKLYFEKEGACCRFISK